MINKIIFILVAAFSISGCSKKYNITPDTLPSAHVNQQYHQLINISGGKVIDKYAELKNNIPDDLGLIIQPANDLDGYNIIEIKGTPKYKGTFTVHISVDFYSGGGAEIDQTYTILVKD